MARRCILKPLIFRSNGYFLSSAIFIVPIWRTNISIYYSASDTEFKSMVTLWILVFWRCTFLSLRLLPYLFKLLISSYNTLRFTNKKNGLYGWKMVVVDKPTSTNIHTKKHNIQPTSTQKPTSESKPQQNNFEKWLVTPWWHL